MSKGIGGGGLLRKKVAKKRTVLCKEFMKGMYRVIGTDRKDVQYYAIYNSSQDLWLRQNNLWSDSTDFYGNCEIMTNFSMRYKKAVETGRIHLIPCNVYGLIKVIEHVEHSYMFLDMDVTGSFKVTEGDT
jgi:hypothetical protein